MIGNCSKRWSGSWSWSSLGLRGYGGNYSFHAEANMQERQNALQQLERSKLDRQREQHAMLEQRERQQRRQARGDRRGKEANQAKILLGRQKERSESSAGKVRQQQAAALQQVDERIREAAQEVENEAPISLHSLPVQAAQRRVAELDAVELPFVSEAARRISLVLTGQQRVGVVGPNGCGKSTLLKVIAGHLAPLAGTCRVAPESAYLDQRLVNLHPEQSVLD